MAERRMFAKAIIDSDAFLDMPLSTQALYFHLSMRADDDGFINNPRKIQRTVGASDDDLKILILKRFLLPFESGVVVVKHWKIHNYIQKDRYKPTIYTEEKDMICTKENGVYTECIQDVSKVDTQVRLELGKDSIELGKDSIESGKDSIESDKDSIEKDKTVRHKYGWYKNVLLTDAEYEKLQNEFPQDYSDRIDRLSEYIKSTGRVYKDHLATIRMWARKEKDKPVAATTKKSSGNPFLDMLSEGGNFQ